MSATDIRRLQEKVEANYIVTMYEPELPWHTGWFNIGRCKKHVKAGPYAGRCELVSEHDGYWHALERGMEMGLKS